MSKPYHQTLQKSEHACFFSDHGQLSHRETKARVMAESGLPHQVVPNDIEITGKSPRGCVDLAMPPNVIVVPSLSRILKSMLGI